MPGRPNVAWYSRTVSYTGSSTAVRPVVGCGNTPQKWASSNRPTTKTITQSLVYNVWCNDPTSGNGSCYTGTLPKTNTRNWFAAGNCTWGAAELWKKATGTYPSWSGNAKDWAVNAGNQGFRISGVPHARSIAVSPATSTNSYGHVMWVTRVWVSNGVTYFRVREMNAVGFNKWSERTVRYETRYKFIVPPVGVPVYS